ncbi:hypothetical protein GCM10025780_24660 [Frondihabitans cladoniiphilus]|uniref:Tripartite tricarboxylate transporter TctB family protein n=1 Tax=Frondihabitans cladoniiphilus TaxID=715785 RepID=A0ABP8W2V3_9MICO
MSNDDDRGATPAESPRNARPESTPAAPEGHPVGLPAEVFALADPAASRKTGPGPRRGDLVLTVILTVVLYLLAFRYVDLAVTRDQQASALLDGVQLSTILAVAAPIVLAVFSTVFSILFIRRRVIAFWLPVFAGILIVALYQVTQQLLETAVLKTFH